MLLFNESRPEGGGRRQSSGVGELLVDELWLGGGGSAWWGVRAQQHLGAQLRCHLVHVRQCLPYVRNTPCSSMLHALSVLPPCACLRFDYGLRGLWGIFPCHVVLLAPSYSVTGIQLIPANSFLRPPLELPRCQ